MGEAGSVNRKYARREAEDNKILTQNVAIGLDGRRRRRNLNVLVCGGSCVDNILKHVQINLTAHLLRTPWRDRSVKNELTNKLFPNDLLLKRKRF